MNKLISLEIKRNGLKTYHTAVLIVTAIMLCFLYLLAVIPKLDPTETDLGLFMTYNSLTNLINIICMVIFVILSSVMFSKFVVEEYSGKRAVLLFSYPVDRKRILGAKVIMVFSYTVISMFLCGVVIFGIFFITENLFPICADTLKLTTFFSSLLSLLCYSLLSGVLSIVSLWFGFWKKSISTTIVAAVIISTVVCQIMAATITYYSIVLGVLVLGVIAAALVLKDLFHRVEQMEV